MGFSRYKRESRFAIHQLGRVIFEFNSYLIDNVIQCSTIEVQTNKGGA